MAHFGHHKKKGRSSFLPANGRGRGHSRTAPHTRIEQPGPIQCRSGLDPPNKKGPKTEKYSKNRPVFDVQTYFFLKWERKCSIFFGIKFFLVFSVRTAPIGGARGQRGRKLIFETATKNEIFKKKLWGCYCGRQCSSVNCHRCGRTYLHSRRA